MKLSERKSRIKESIEQYKERIKEEEVLLEKYEGQEEVKESTCYKFISEVKVLKEVEESNSCGAISYHSEKVILNSKEVDGVEFRFAIEKDSCTKNIYLTVDENHYLTDSCKELLQSNLTRIINSQIKV